MHRVTRRLRRLTAAAESISEGEFAVEVEVEVASPRADELGRLSRAVQRMAQRLDEYVSGQKRALGNIVRNALRYAGMEGAIARTCVEGLGGSIRGWNREGGGFAVERRFPDVS